MKTLLLGILSMWVCHLAQATPPSLECKGIFSDDGEPITLTATVTTNTRLVDFKFEEGSTDETNLRADSTYHSRKYAQYNRFNHSLIGNTFDRGNCGLLLPKNLLERNKPFKAIDQCTFGSYGGPVVNIPLKCELR